MSLRIAYLVKRSSWTVFSERETAPRFRRLIRRRDATVARMRGTHDDNERTIEEVFRAFESLGAEPVAIASRTKDITSKRFSLVVTVGGDGTLLRASHKVGDVPVLGINSAPESSVGFFCGARKGGVLEALERAIDGRLPKRTLARMSVSVEGKVVSKRILNDALFCHTSPAATSRYLIDIGGVSEEQKSSGFWVGPAAGSTAAQRSAGGRVLPLESEVLQLVVREAYTPMGERHELKRVVVPAGERIVVKSKMREAAIFLDGPDVVAHPEFGDEIIFETSDEPLHLLGIRGRKR